VDKPLDDDEMNSILKFIYAAKAFCKQKLCSERVKIRVLGVSVWSGRY
jgi:hypothetical protein